MGKQSQSPVSPSGSASHLLFNNSFAAAPLYTGQQPGSGSQAFPPGVASNAFSFPLMNNGNLAPSSVSPAKADLAPDGLSQGSSSVGSDISSNGSPENM